MESGADEGAKLKLSEEESDERHQAARWTAYATQPRLRLSLQD